MIHSSTYVCKFVLQSSRQSAKSNLCGRWQRRETFHDGLEAVRYMCPPHISEKIFRGWLTVVIFVQGCVVSLFCHRCYKSVSWDTVGTEDKSSIIVLQSDEKYCSQGPNRMILHEGVGEFVEPVMSICRSILRCVCGVIENSLNKDRKTTVAQGYKESKMVAKGTLLLFYIH